MRKLYYHVSYLILKFSCPKGFTSEQHEEFVNLTEKDFLDCTKTPFKIKSRKPNQLFAFSTRTKQKTIIMAIYANLRSDAPLYEDFASQPYEYFKNNLLKTGVEKEIDVLDLTAWVPKNEEEGIPATDGLRLKKPRIVESPSGEPLSFRRIHARSGIIKSFFHFVNILPDTIFSINIKGRDIVKMLSFSIIARKEFELDSDQEDDFRNSEITLLKNELEKKELLLEELMNQISQFKFKAEQTRNKEIKRIDTIQDTY